MIDEFDSFFNEFKNRKISFSRKKMRLESSLSMDLKITILVIFIYKCCSGNKSSLKKLQLFYANSGKEEDLENLILSLEGDSSLYSSNCHFDPTLVTVLNFMVSYGLLEKEASFRYKLSSKGIAFAKEILKDKNIVSNIKEKLAGKPVRLFSETNFLRVFKESM